MSIARRALMATADALWALTKVLLTLAAVAALGAGLVTVMYLLWDKTPDQDPECVDISEVAQSLEDAWELQEYCDNL